ncbi:NAD-dependent epimerase/dehydratase family protein [Brevundimonas sp. SL130]|uniref:NAD-dependent epimerase/dehydratase family protein n=1 Tax=Brevundimonas sp. SL130 TaxID=2995143 RepID=UPI00226D19AA|nr:NAD-dependent epimerase/dehydratase family protein [Brevundimonas sp. SL130]WAC59036.1 NAD-dependent epimerase/dehydratase family protein [Brevundimonas sp. SL130]
MRILVTGADGFLGRAMVRRLADLDGATVVATDRAFSTPAPADGVEQRSGDLSDASFLAELTQTAFDWVFHLASMPGSLAERDPEAGRRVNLLVPIALAEALARARSAIRPRLVFASSIAVYGDLGEAVVTPSTPTTPTLSYGAHKLMTEFFLSDLHRRGDLSAVSLRLPGLVARPLEESGHGSAFMSRLIRHAAAGASYDCPVGPDAVCWWMSRETAANALLHAAQGAFAATVVQPPALRLTTAEVAEAAAALGGSPLKVSWGSDAALTRLFGALPPLDASAAIDLGFPRDADAAALVRAALRD